MDKRRVHFLFLITLFLGALCAPTFARAPDESEFIAAGTLGREIADWISTIKPEIKSIAIFSVFSEEPLDQEYSAIVEGEIIQNLRRHEMEHVSSCSECRAPQINIEGELLIVRKGMPDMDTLKKMGERHPVDAFLTVDIYRSSLSVLAQATLYANPSGTIMGAERFTAAALNIVDSGVQLLVTAGAGKILGTGADLETNLSLAGNISLLEALGFGKGGLSLGVIASSSNGTLLYLNPTLQLGGRVGATSLAYTFSGGAGFGFNGSTKGLSLRGTCDFYLGSFTIVGFEAVYFMPQTSTPGVFSTYAGLHLGFSLGR